MRGVLLLVTGLALQACSLPQALPTATEVKTGSPEVVVIGKIELVPPINPALEQHRYWNVLGEERMLSNVIIATNPEYKAIDTSQPRGRDFHRMVEITPPKNIYKRRDDASRCSQSRAIMVSGWLLFRSA